MNIQKDLLRLTLVISIMAAVLTLLSNEIFLPRNSVKVEITEMWRNKSFQEKLKGVDDLLENNREFHNLSKIEQLNIKRRIKESVPSVEKNLKVNGGKIFLVSHMFSALDGEN